MLKKIFVGVVDVHRHSAPTCASKTSLLTQALFVSSTWMALRTGDLVHKSNPLRARLASYLALLLLALVSVFVSVAPTPEIYSLSLHDALPIWRPAPRRDH